MKVVIRYRVRPDHIAEHRRLLGNVFAEMRDRQPKLRYEVFPLEQEGEYVELVEGDTVPRVLTELPAFGTYRAGLDERCDQPPQMTEIHDDEFSYRPAV